MERFGIFLFIILLLSQKCISMGTNLSKIRVLIFCRTSQKLVKDLKLIVNIAIILLTLMFGKSS